VTTDRLAPKQVAFAFLQAFWDGQPERGYALCRADARWQFQRSLHDPDSVSVREAVEWLTSALISGFAPDSGYTVQLRDVIGEGDEAAIEYSATGRTRRGEIYDNRYVVRFTIVDGQIVSIRPYFDTHYLSRTLYDLDAPRA
jgi:ketosteroid isomerase-like protein